MKHTIILMIWSMIGCRFITLGFNCRWYATIHLPFWKVNCVDTEDATEFGCLFKPENGVVEATKMMIEKGCITLIPGTILFEDGGQTVEYQKLYCTHCGTIKLPYFKTVGNNMNQPQLATQGTSVVVSEAHSDPSTTRVSNDGSNSRSGNKQYWSGASEYNQEGDYTSGFENYKNHESVKRPDIYNSNGYTESTNNMNGGINLNLAKVGNSGYDSVKPDDRRSRHDTLDSSLQNVRISKKGRHRHNVDLAPSSVSEYDSRDSSSRQTNIKDTEPSSYKDNSESDKEKMRYKKRRIPSSNRKTVGEERVVNVKVNVKVYTQSGH